MGFVEAVRTGLRKFADFRGRAARSEFWFFILFATLVWGLAFLVDWIAFQLSLGIFTGLTQLMLALPVLAVTTRRLHDTGRSGIWVAAFCVYAIAAPVAALSVLVDIGMKGDPGGGRMATLISLSLGWAGFTFAMIVLCALKGSKGSNKYGADLRAADAF
jgi:uncharacterized membrane protein YhaH (DUF805 family)